MLIFLTDQLSVQLEDTNALASDSIDALENLALGWREGNHIVVGTRKAIRAIVHQEGLSRRAHAAFRQIQGRLSEYLGLVRVIATRVEVTGLTTNERRVRDRDKEVLEVPLKFFSSSSSIQQTILLTENLTDARFFYNLVRTIAEELKLGRLHYKAELRGGGGSTITAEFRQIQDSNIRFCLAIADSDKKYAGSSAGPVADELLKSDTSSRVRSEALILPCRSAENLIPCSVLRAISPDFQAVVDLLDRLAKDGDLLLRAHLDLKRGLTLEYVFELPSDSPERIFWEDRLGYLKNICGFSKTCVRTGTCRMGAGCSCIIHNGLGRKILSDAVDHICSFSRFDQVQIDDEFTKSYFSEIGQVILAWSCSLPPRRT